MTDVDDLTSEEIEGADYAEDVMEAALAAEQPKSRRDYRFAYVHRSEGFDVVFVGRRRKRAGFFPAHVAHTETKEWAQAVVDALELSAALDSDLHTKETS